jgi:hypothetical protein
MAKYVSLLSFPAFWPTIGPWKSWFNRAEVAAAKTGTGHADWFGFQTEEKKTWHMYAHVLGHVQPFGPSMSNSISRRLHFCPG